MTAKFELSGVRELVRIYRETPERIAANRRARLIATTVGWTLIFGAAALSWFKILDGMICVVIAAVGGFVAGLSFMYLLSAEWISILARYTTLKNEEVGKVLEDSRTA